MIPVEFEEVAAAFDMVSGSGS